MALSPVLAALPAGVATTMVRAGDKLVLAFGVVDQVRRADPDPGALLSLDDLQSGWWAGFASYDAGRSVERVVERIPVGRVPVVNFLRFAARAEVGADGGLVLVGSGAERRALERAFDAPSARVGLRPSAPWSSTLDRLEYERRVLEIQELIRAGDCYQVNLTRQLTGPPLDPVALFAATESGNPAPHTMFFREGELAIVSASPERFLSVDGRAVETRPIKGTAARAARLLTSEKDRAENIMIVDLARNDLGRVCVPGSIHSPELCEVETHPGLVHLVSTVHGALRPDVGLGALLQATFPPASITGAPKPRVMQAIEDLEPVRRGVYCGAVGWIDADRERADLAVAIRTFTCTETETSFGVGAGITIDSDPGSEWAETELKAQRLLALAGEHRIETASAARS